MLDRDQPSWFPVDQSVVCSVVVDPEMSCGNHATWKALIDANNIGVPVRRRPILRSRAKTERSLVTILIGVGEVLGKRVEGWKLHDPPTVIHRIHPKHGRADVSAETGKMKNDDGSGSSALLRLHCSEERSPRPGLTRRMRLSCPSVGAVARRALAFHRDDIIPRNG